MTGTTAPGQPTTSDGQPASTSTSTGPGPGPGTGTGTTGDAQDTGAATSTGESPMGVCGDGVVDPGEACDDGEGNGPGEPCSATCQLVACGDGTVDPGEECDGGAMNGDMNSCKSDCTENVCGDGSVGPGEGCDDGNRNDGDECTGECALATCGDGVIAPTEQCDDGNQANTDACTNTCTGAACGDGFVQDGEACDDGPDNSSHALCTPDCQVNVCGDGFVHDDGGPEACDDGADNGPGQACNAACELNVCGDGDKGPGEPCDDGNVVGGDGCSAMCGLEKCGNKLIDVGEACDDGADGDQDDGCTDVCAIPACGDGFVQASLTETCDLGGQNSNTGACTLACKTAACGDGFIHANVEQCDDGANNGDNKACKADCTVKVCGDGLVGPGEACDDGNQNNGDGCTNVCKLATCGDGFVQGAEQCDEGAANSDAGACKSNCQTAVCGDGLIRAGVEVCDGANLANKTCMSQGYASGQLKCSADCKALVDDACMHSSPNVAFVSSTKHRGDLGSRDAYDAICMARAAEKGLPGTFVAYLGTSTKDPIARLEGSLGWVRVDGRPIANTPADLAADRFYYPLHLDETGARVEVAVYTGATDKGKTYQGRTCGDWSNPAGQGEVGTSARPAWWDSYGVTVGCNALEHIYCFQVGRKFNVAPPAPPGRVAWVAGARPATGGLAAFDAACEAEATAAGFNTPARVFKALLSTTVTPAASRFNAAKGPWYRLDGVLLATTGANLMAGNLLAALTLTADGQQFHSNVWSGATSPLNVAAQDCAGFQSANAMLSTRTGHSGDPDAAFFNYDDRACGPFGWAFYCLEE